MDCVYPDIYTYTEQLSWADGVREGNTLWKELSIYDAPKCSKEHPVSYYLLSTQLE